MGTRYKQHSGENYNSAGYRDEPYANVLKKQARLDEIERIEQYENLCRDLRKLTEERGFHFAGQIWLVENMTGRKYTNG